MDGRGFPENMTPPPFGEGEGRGGGGVGGVELAECGFWGGLAGAGRWFQPIELRRGGLGWIFKNGKGNGWTGFPVISARLPVTI